MWLYRGLMLAWALWLALAVLRWLGWAWSCFSAGRGGATLAQGERAGSASYSIVGFQDFNGARHLMAARDRTDNPVRSLMGAGHRLFGEGLNLGLYFSAFRKR